MKKMKKVKGAKRPLKAKMQSKSPAMKATIKKYVKKKGY